MQRVLLRTPLVHGVSIDGIKALLTEHPFSEIPLTPSVVGEQSLGRFLHHGRVPLPSLPTENHRSAPSGWAKSIRKSCLTRLPRQASCTSGRFCPTEESTAFLPPWRG